MKTKQKTNWIFPVLIAVAAVLFVTILLLEAREPEAVEEPQTQEATQPASTYPVGDTPEERLEAMAHSLDLPLDTWPDYMQELLKKNPDAEEYVLYYPLRKDETYTVDLSDCVGTGEVPRLYQWDKRWGYTQYGDKELGLTGCGPTCLSMVCLYFLQDAKYTPRYVADYAEANGHYTVGYGSNWTLMSEAAAELGLKVVTIPPNAERIMANLEVGNLVILAMGPGDFTTSGHFILLAGAQDGLAVIHDPNSVTNSEKLWDVSSFRSQIENVWVFQPIEE